MKKTDRNWIGLAVGVMVAWCATGASAGEWFVNASAIAGGDGQTPETAYTGIQEAVESAVVGDVVWVADGTYAGGIQTMNKRITVKSVNGPDYTFIDGGGTILCVNVSLEGSGHLTNTYFIGFTLQNGYTTVDGGGVFGGTYSNCVFKNNHAVRGGGAAYEADLYNCIVIGNTTAGSPSGGGGGVRSSVLYDCQVISNKSLRSGGGALNSTLYNCLVAYNEATSNGGGLQTGTAIGCTIVSNTAVANGGGTSSIKLSYSTVKYNRAGANGGGAWFGGADTDYYNLFLYNQGGAGGGVFRNARTAPLLNSVIYGNVAVTNGGGVSRGVYVNCIVQGNYLANGDASDYGSTGASTYPVFSNSCITTFGTLATANSTGNIYDAPLFAGLSSDDFRLRPGSPGLGAGLVSAATTNATITTDFLGQPRPTLIGGDVYTLSMGVVEAAADVYVTTDPIEYSMSSAGGEVEVSVVANVEWEVSSLESWLSFPAGATGSGDATLRVAVAENDSGGAREGRFQLFSGTLTNWVTIRQIPSLQYYVAKTGSDTNDGLSWDSPKLTIPGALTAAQTNVIVRGDLIWVSNGVYSAFEVPNNLPITIRAASSNPADTVIDGGGAATCVILGQSASDHASTLHGFTVRNGRNQHGGGARMGTLVNCVLSNNVATENGGGAWNSVLKNCVVVENEAVSGAGAYQCDVTGSIIHDNTATQTGGGLLGGTAVSALIYGNHAAIGGGAYQTDTINCTIADNRATDSAAGVNAGTHQNGIIFSNCLDDESPADYSGVPAFFYCGIPAGDMSGSSRNNVFEDPLFFDSAAGDFHLVPVSPCFGAGNLSAVPDGASTDVYGDSRFTTNGAAVSVSMGAIETPAEFYLQPLPMTVSATDSAQTIQMDVFANVEWSVLPPVEAWLGIQGATNGNGNGSVQLRLTQNDTGITRTGTIHVASSSPEISKAVTIIQYRKNWIYYVATTGDDGNGGSSWDSPKASIQDALDSLSSGIIPGDTIWVRSGTYDSFVYTANLPVTIRAESTDPSLTVINGQGSAPCAVLGTEPSHHNATLIGFTLANGYAAQGGGVQMGTLQNCVLEHNIATEGGGAWNSVLKNCIVRDNAAATGGGMLGGQAYNCLFIRNHAEKDGGGGAIGESGWSTYNCTITENTAFRSAAGVQGGAHNNSIVWNNQLTGTPAIENYAGAPIFAYSCTTAGEMDASSTANIFENPLFANAPAGDFRLADASPCAALGDVGQPSAMMAFDLAGVSRTTSGGQGITVNMGAYEALVSDYVVPVSSQFFLPAEGSTATIRAIASDEIWVAQIVQGSDWLEGVFSLPESGLQFVASENTSGSNRTAIIHVMSETQTNVINITQCRYPLTIFVKPASSGGDDVADGLSWATAKATLQGAVDETAVRGFVSGDRVWVTNGTYDAFSYLSGYALTIESVNGAGETEIFAGYTKPGAVFFNTNASLSGFTIRGGVSVDADYAGGVTFGTLFNCVLRDNAGPAAGGVMRSILNACVVENNTGENGGGAAQSELRSCLIVSNQATASGGGAYDSQLFNCTVVSNSAAVEGGGVALGAAYNSILWNNAGGNHAGADVGFSLTTAGSGASATDGNILGRHPEFLDEAAGNYRLSNDSPAFLAASADYVRWPQDLDGKPRISALGGVNMGAYQPAGWFVDRNSPAGAAGDGSSWATAFTNIQDAVSAAAAWTGNANFDAYEYIWVKAGVYTPIQTGNKFVVIEAVDTLDACVIDGGGQTSAVRASVTASGDSTHTNSIVADFTIRGGSATYGGGTLGGTIMRSLITDNDATYGGGSAYSVLVNTKVTNNRTTFGGAGMYHGVAYASLILNNTAQASAGGVNSANTVNCVIFGNTTAASASAGGAFGGFHTNSIIWGNVAADAEKNLSGSISLAYCLAPQEDIAAFAFSHCVTNRNPLFEDSANGDFRLAETSGAIATGNPLAVNLHPLDMSGLPLVQGGVVNMGAYAGVMPARLVIEPTSFSLLQAAIDTTLTVDSNLGWEALTVSDWIQWESDDASGTGSAIIPFHVPANATTNSRAGGIVIRDMTGAHSVTASVVQAASAATLQISSNSVSYDAGAGISSFNIQANVMWGAAVDPSTSTWVSITSPKLGRDDATLAYSVSANTTTNSRTATINVYARDAVLSTQQFVITQAAGSPFLFASPNQVNSPSSATNESIAVNANVSWQASVTSSWLSITSGASGQYDGRIEISVLENAPTNSRSSTVILVSTDLPEVLTQKVTVVQSGAPLRLAVTPSSVTASGAGETGNAATITANVAWRAFSTSNWITIASGSPSRDDGSITYNVAANTITNTRTGTITLAATDAAMPSATLTVSQQPGVPTMTLQTSSAQLAADGTEVSSISVRANVAWQASVTSGGDFITIVSGATGRDNATVGYHVAAHTTTNSRTGSITITSTDASLPAQVFTINQQAAPPFIRLPVSSTSITSNGTAAATFDVEANVAWQARSNTYWVSVTGNASGRDNASVSYAVANNITTNNRSTQITVSSTDSATAPAAFTITQAAGPAFMTLPMTSTTIGAEASAGNVFAVSANVAWATLSDSSWLTINVYTVGRDSANVLYSVAENTATNERVATITVTNTDSSLPSMVYTVTQEGADPFLTVSPAAFSSPYIGSSGHTVTVSANTEWDVFSVSDWVDMTPDSGTYSGTFSITAQSNRAATARQADIWVRSSAGIIQTVRVVQAAAPAFLSIAEEEAVFTHTVHTNQSLDVIANTDWTVSVDGGEEWITLTTTSGNSDGRITYHVAENAAYTNRSGSLLLAWDAGGEARLYILQMAPTIFTQTLEMGADGDVTLHWEPVEEPVVLQFSATLTRWDTIQTNLTGSTVVIPAEELEAGTGFFKLNYSEE